MSVTKGSPLVLESEEIRFAPGQGYNSTYIESGPKELITARMGTYVGAGFETQITKRGRGPHYQLIATRAGLADGDPGSESNIVNDDELLSNDVQQSILLSPKLRDLIPESVLAVIIAQKETVTSGAQSYSDATGEITAACLAASISNGDALSTFDDLLLGRDSYETNAYTYRRTYTVNNQSSLRAAFDNINLIHTTDEVRAAEGTPGDFPLPDGYWRKLGPKVTSGLRQLTLITYDYEWGTGFNSRYYDFVTP